MSTQQSELRVKYVVIRNALRAALPKEESSSGRRAIHLFLCFLRGRTLHQCEPTGRSRLHWQFVSKTTHAARVMVANHGPEGMGDLKLERKTDFTVGFENGISVHNMLDLFGTWLRNENSPITGLVGTDPHGQVVGWTPAQDEPVQEVACA